MSAEQVRNLRDRGESLRRIARSLRIGKTTAARILSDANLAPNVSQNCGDPSQNSASESEPLRPARIRVSCLTATPARTRESGARISQLVFTRKDGL